MGFLLQKNVKWVMLANEKMPPNALFSVGLVYLPPELGYILMPFESSSCKIERCSIGDLKSETLIF